MALRDQAISRGASILIFNPSDVMELPEYNFRNMESPETIAYVRSMADAILSNGVAAFPPITIRRSEDGQIAVMAGWCRRRAHILAMSEGADIKGIQCIDAGKKSKDEIYLDVLTSNTQLPLTAMEKAKGVKALLNGLWTPADIAKKTGWSISTVSNLIALYDAPDEISQMVQDGVVSATFATEIMKSNTPDEAVKKLKSAANTAKDAGKKKATRKDLKDATEKGISWKAYGPKMYKLLSDIYECPVSDRGRLQNAIAAAGELLATLEEEYPALRVESGCGGEEF
jgi:ParB-like chromosome segregation protein Spo0J